MDFDLDKKWGKKCLTGQTFICIEVTSYKIYTSVAIFTLFDMTITILVNQVSRMRLLQVWKFSKLRKVTLFWPIHLKAN